MSGLTLRNLIVDRVRDVGSRARHVLLVLSRFANAKTFECYPSQERIAECTGFSVRVVRDALHELEAHRHIAIVGRRPVPRGFVPVYRIATPTTGNPRRQSAADHRQESPPVEARPPAEIVTTTGRNRHRPPAGSADKQIKEKRSGNRSSSRAARAESSPSTSSSGGRRAAELQQKQKAEGHQPLLEHWAKTYEQSRGVKPLVDAREGKGASLLLERFTLTEAKAMVDNAFARGEYFPSGSLLVIGQRPNEFRGRPMRRPSPASSATRLLQPDAPTKRDEAAE